MEFQLWEHEKADDGESRCFAKRSKIEVKQEFYNMKVGEDRVLRENNNIIITIVRSK